jgi:hypothetical protein
MIYTPMALRAATSAAFPVAKTRQTKAMHNTYVASLGRKSVRFAPVIMRFGSLLDELELAETEGRSPRLRVGKERTLSTSRFTRFCRAHALHNAGQWNGVCVYTRPEFVWPPLSCDPMRVLSSGRSFRKSGNQPLHKLRSNSRIPSPLKDIANL